VELPVNEQMLSAVMAGLCGVVFGVIYDFMKALRLELKNGIVTSLCDIAVCLVGAFMLLFLNMEATGGRLRIYIALTAALGAAAYFLCCSPYILKVFVKVLVLIGRLLKLFGRLLAILRKNLKKVEKFFKKSFQNLRKWFTIMGNYGMVGNRPGLGRNTKGMERGYEDKKIQSHHTHRHRGADTLCRDKSGRLKVPDAKRRGKARRAAAAGGRRRAGKRGTAVRH